MPLYTGKGDRGTTKVFDTPKGHFLSKSSRVIEALGALDELNSFLGLCKVKSGEADYYVGKEFPSFHHILHMIQKNLFIVQAELAGAEKTIEESKVHDLEAIINAAEEDLPPITSFFISGGTELAAQFDVARTIARRTERRVVDAHNRTARSVGEHSLAYLNRLSSLLYAFARLSNHKAGMNEDAPDYR